MQKKIIIIIVILILAITGVVLLLKYRGSFNTPKPQPPAAKKEEPKTVKLQPGDAIGSVVSRSDQELVILTGAGEIKLDITSGPATYTLDGERRIDKTVSDLKVGSLVKVHYLDNTARKVPLVILVDKF